MSSKRQDKKHCIRRCRQSRKTGTLLTEIESDKKFDIAQLQRTLGAALHSLNMGHHCLTALDDLCSHDTMNFQLPQVSIPCSACVEQHAKEPNSSICLPHIISQSVQVREGSHHDSMLCEPDVSIHCTVPLHFLSLPKTCS